MRNLHRPGEPLGGNSAGVTPDTEHDFAGHQRDRESGLVQMGARSYLDLAGVFLSPDPRWTAAAALGAGSEEDRKSFADYLAHPQMGNLYAYALRQPLKYVDPEGLDVVFSPSLAKDPNFKYAWKAFASTKQAQMLLKRLSFQGGKVFLTAGEVEGRAYPQSVTTKLDINAKKSMAVVTIDVAKYARFSKFIGPAETLDLMAWDLYAELRAVNLHLEVEEINEHAITSLNAYANEKVPSRGIPHLQNALEWFKAADRLVNWMKEPRTDPRVNAFKRELAADQEPK